MATMTAAATMTDAERLATEAFRADLLDEFRQVTADLILIKDVPGLERAWARVKDEVRALYGEIKEVEFCLATNVLPF